MFFGGCVSGNLAPLSAASPKRRPFRAAVGHRLLENTNPGLIRSKSSTERVRRGEPVSGRHGPERSESSGSGEHQEQGIQRARPYLPSSPQTSPLHAEACLSAEVAWHRFLVFRENRRPHSRSLLLADVVVLGRPQGGNVLQALGVLATVTTGAGAQGSGVGGAGSLFNYAIKALLALAMSSFGP